MVNQTALNISQGKPVDPASAKNVRQTTADPSTISMSGWTLRLGQRCNRGRGRDVLCRLHGVSGVSLNVLNGQLSY